MAPAGRMATYFHVHLVSDSTGETLNAIARAVCARFSSVLPIEHIYALVRSQAAAARGAGGDRRCSGRRPPHDRRSPPAHLLEDGCRALAMPCMAALDPLIAAFSRQFGAPLTSRVGAQYALEHDYFNRMEALSFAMGHDDGQGGEGLGRADVVLVGVSRTSKTPTCIYLAHRGVRAGNVPLVAGADLPPILLGERRPPVVGLTISPDRLIQIRLNRLKGLDQHRENAYVDADAVREEIVQARRLYERRKWPVIDVTRRSVEETAAAVINIISGGRGQVEVLG